MGGIGAAGKISPHLGGGGAIGPAGRSGLYAGVAKLDLLSGKWHEVHGGSLLDTAGRPELLRGCPAPRAGHAAVGVGPYIAVHGGLGCPDAQRLVASASASAVHAQRRMSDPGEMEQIPGTSASSAGPVSSPAVSPVGAATDSAMSAIASNLNLLSDMWFFDTRDNSWLECDSLSMATAASARVQELLRSQSELSAHEARTVEPGSTPSAVPSLGSPLAPSSIATPGGALKSPTSRARVRAASGSVTARARGTWQYNRGMSAGELALRSAASAPLPVNAQALTLLPKARQSHAMALWLPHGDARRPKLVLFGGLCAAPAGGSQAARGLAAGEAPDPASARSIRSTSDVSAPRKAKLRSGKPMNDLWVFDINTGAWQPIAIEAGCACPAPRSQAAVHVHHNTLYIFGGLGQRGALGDVWCADLSPLADMDNFVVAGMARRLFPRAARQAMKQLHDPTVSGPSHPADAASDAGDSAEPASVGAGIASSFSSLTLPAAHIKALYDALHAAVLPAISWKCCYNKTAMPAATPQPALTSTGALGSHSSPAAKPGSTTGAASHDFQFDNASPRTQVTTTSAFSKAMDFGGVGQSAGPTPHFGSSVAPDPWNPDALLVLLGRGGMGNKPGKDVVTWRWNFSQSSWRKLRTPPELPLSDAASLDEMPEPGLCTAPHRPNRRLRDALVPRARVSAAAVSLTPTPDQLAVAKGWDPRAVQSGWKDPVAASIVRLAAGLALAQPRSVAQLARAAAKASESPSPALPGPPAGAELGYACRSIATGWWEVPPAAVGGPFAAQGAWGARVQERTNEHTGRPTRAVYDPTAQQRRAMRVEAATRRVLLLGGIILAQPAAASGSVALAPSRVSASNASLTEAERGRVSFLDVESVATDGAESQDLTGLPAAQSHAALRPAAPADACTRREGETIAEFAARVNASGNVGALWRARCGVALNGTRSMAASSAGTAPARASSRTTLDSMSITADTKSVGGKSFQSAGMTGQADMVTPQPTAGYAPLHELFYLAIAPPELRADRQMDPLPVCPAQDETSQPVPEESAALADEFDSDSCSDSSCGSDVPLSAAETLAMSQANMLRTLAGGKLGQSAVGAALRTEASASQLRLASSGGLLGSRAAADLSAAATATAPASMQPIRVAAASEHEGQPGCGGSDSDADEPSQRPRRSQASKITLLKRSAGDTGTAADRAARTRGGDKAVRRLPTGTALHGGVSPREANELQAAAKRAIARAHRHAMARSMGVLTSPSRALSSDLELGRVEERAGAVFEGDLVAMGAAEVVTGAAADRARAAAAAAALAAEDAMPVQVAQAETSPLPRARAAQRLQSMCDTAETMFTPLQGGGAAAARARASQGSLQADEVPTDTAVARGLPGRLFRPNAYPGTRRGFGSTNDLRMHRPEDRAQGTASSPLLPRRCPASQLQAEIVGGSAAPSLTWSQVLQLNGRGRHPAARPATSADLDAMSTSSDEEGPVVASSQQAVNGASRPQVASAQAKHDTWENDLDAPNSILAALAAGVVDAGSTLHGAGKQPRPVEVLRKRWRTSASAARNEALLRSSYSQPGRGLVSTLSTTDGKAWDTDADLVRHTLDISDSSSEDIAPAADSLDSLTASLTSSTAPLGKVKVPALALPHSDSTAGTQPLAGTRSKFSKPVPRRSPSAIAGSAGLGGAGRRAPGTRSEPPPEVVAAMTVLSKPMQLAVNAGPAGRRLASDVLDPHFVSEVRTHLRRLAQSASQAGYGPEEARVIPPRVTQVGNVAVIQVADFASKLAAAKAQELSAQPDSARAVMRGGPAHTRPPSRSSLPAKPPSLLHQLDARSSELQAEATKAAAPTRGDKARRSVADLAARASAGPGKEIARSGVASGVGRALAQPPAVPRAALGTVAKRQAGTSASSSSKTLQTSASAGQTRHAHLLAADAAASAAATQFLRSQSLMASMQSGTSLLDAVADLPATARDLGSAAAPGSSPMTGKPKRTALAKSAVEMVAPSSRARAGPATAAPPRSVALSAFDVAVPQPSLTALRHDLQQRRRAMAVLARHQRG